MDICNCMSTSTTGQARKVIQKQWMTKVLNSYSTTLHLGSEIPVVDFDKPLQVSLNLTYGNLQGTNSVDWDISPGRLSSYDLKKSCHESESRAFDAVQISRLRWSIFCFPLSLDFCITPGLCSCSLSRTSRQLWFLLWGDPANRWFVYTPMANYLFRRF